MGQCQGGPFRVGDLYSGPVARHEHGRLSGDDDEGGDQVAEQGGEVGLGPLGGEVLHVDAFVGDARLDVELHVGTVRMEATDLDREN